MNDIEARKLALDILLKIESDKQKAYYEDKRNEVWKYDENYYIIDDHYDDENENYDDDDHYEDDKYDYFKYDYSRYDSRYFDERNFYEEF